MFRVRAQIDCDRIPGGYTGKGVTAAILDTGIALHPDFEGRVDHFGDFLHRREKPYDDAGHGTHVAGILAGSGEVSAGKYRGIAPECRLVVGKVLDQRGEGSVDAMLKGLAWVREHQREWKISLLNISVGIGKIRWDADMEKLIRAVEELWLRGVVVVAAAGNAGPLPGSMSALGLSGKVITVGCHEGGYFGNRGSLCENYSGRSSDGAAVHKPDVVAPGTDIISCDYHVRRTIRGWQHPYVQKSGTSMAAPIVSGAAALYLQKNKNARPEDVKRSMLLSATDLKRPWTEQGWGMINVRRMLEK